MICPLKPIYHPISYILHREFLKALHTRAESKHILHNPSKWGNSKSHYKTLNISTGNWQDFKVDCSPWLGSDTAGTTRTVKFYFSHLSLNFISIIPWSRQTWYKSYNNHGFFYLQFAFHYNPWANLICILVYKLTCWTSLDQLRKSSGKYNISDPSWHLGYL